MNAIIRVLIVVVLATGCRSAPELVPAPAPAPTPVAAPAAPPAEPVPPVSAQAPPPPPETPAPDYEAWLEHFDRHTGKRQLFPIQSGKVVRVGRSSPDQANPDIDLGQLHEGDTVSRRHAEILQRDGTWMLFIQPDTTNRSFLNQAIVDRGSLNPLKEGDEIQLGGVTVMFRTRGAKP